MRERQPRAAEWGAAEQWLHLALRAARAARPQRPAHLFAQCPLPGPQQVRAQPPHPHPPLRQSHGHFCAFPGLFLVFFFGFFTPHPTDIPPSQTRRGRKTDSWL